MKSVYLFPAALLLAGTTATPSLAQSDEERWTGGYVGIQGGYRFNHDKDKETILFDTDLDGDFDDTVSTAGAPTTSLFTPGFCGGTGASEIPSTGCGKDKGKADFAVHAGFDKQFGGLVLGLVAEYGRTSISDSVTGYSSEPASYILQRKLKDNAGVRLRAGVATGGTLFFLTGGGAWGRVKNNFISTNTANDFEDNGNDSVWGYRLGGGVEQQLGQSVSIGVQYLYTSLGDGGYRIRASGGAANNPFVRVDSEGTDFRRSGKKFNTSAVAATLNFRF